MGVHYLLKNSNANSLHLYEKSPQLEDVNQAIEVYVVRMRDQIILSLNIVGSHRSRYKVILNSLKTKMTLKYLGVCIHFLNLTLKYWERRVPWSASSDEYMPISSDDVSLFHRTSAAFMPTADSSSFKKLSILIVIGSSFPWGSTLLLPQHRNFYAQITNSHGPKWLFDTINIY